VAEFKLVVSNPKDGKTYQKQYDTQVLKKIRDKKVGDEVDGSAFALPGYTLTVTGGSDKSGFPMRRGIHGTSHPKALLSGGVGYNPKEDERKRKRVRGERIDEDITQVNTKITKVGQRPIAELLGVEEGKEGEAPAEGGDKPAEKQEAPKEEAKEAEKPAEEKPEPEKPAQEEKQASDEKTE